MEMSTIYLSYVETGGNEGIFTSLPNIEAALIAVETRPQGSRVTRIQKIRQQEGQPTIDILCFTFQELSAERSQEIARYALDWLMTEGYTT